jgi:simple sugar transport system substrate-binding protein
MRHPAARTRKSLIQSPDSISAAKPLRLILLTPFVDYSIFEPVKNGAQDAAGAMQVQVTFAGTKDGNLQSLATMVRQAVADGYDGIALNIVDSLAFVSVIAETVGKGVPLIAFNVDDRRAPNARLAAICQDMQAAGEIFGRRIASEIPANSHILLTMHDPNISALEDRALGIKRILASKEIRWTQLFTGTDREQAIEKIHRELAADSTIRIVIGTGLADTEAAGLVVERSASGQKYLTAGFDLSGEILRLVKSGTIYFTVDQQPYSQGYFAVAALTLYKRFGVLPANIDTGAMVIDQNEAERVIELSRKGYR